MSEGEALAILDVLTEIFKFLELKEVLCARLVCKLWRSACASDRIWRVLFVKYFSHSPSFDLDPSDAIKKSYRSWFVYSFRRRYLDEQQAAKALAEQMSAAANKPKNLQIMEFRDLIFIDRFSMQDFSEAADFGISFYGCTFRQGFEFMFNSMRLGFQFIDCTVEREVRTSKLLAVFVLFHPRATRPLACTPPSQKQSLGQSGRVEISDNVFNDFVDGDDSNFYNVVIKRNVFKRGCNWNTGMNSVSFLNDDPSNFADNIGSELQDENPTAPLIS